LASANYHEIYHKIASSLGVNQLTRIENHHNFAWKDQLADGAEVMVHRKGTTPVGLDVLGIIPGSMSTPGFWCVAKVMRIVSIQQATVWPFNEKQLCL
jgi:tRNA-splicing ligase RtcB